MKILTTVVAALLLIQSAAGTQKLRRSETTPARPNILFIVSDDHGWGDLPSNWDKTEVLLPTLDALAAAGLRFSQFCNTAEPTSQHPQTQIKGIIQP